MSRTILGFVCVALVTFEVHAQTQCIESDTFESCSNRLAGQAAPSPSDDAVASAKISDAVSVGQNANKLVALKNTGDGPTANINDFLPLLRALIDTGGFATEAGEKIGVEWSNPLGLPVEHQNKVSIVLQHSTLYEPLKDALRSSGAADQIDPLDERINEGDDVHIGFSYSLASKKYGRDPELHRDLFSMALHAADLPSELVSEARRRRLDFETQHGLTDEQIEGTFAGIPQAARAEYMRLTEAQILAEHASMRQLGRRLQKTGFYGLTDLVNNQPQWSVTADYSARDELVGPHEFHATLAYEFGWANVNAYRRYASDRCGSPEKILCLADYLAQDEVIRELKESRRVTVKAEYSKLRRLEFAIPDVAFAFSTQPAERLSVAVGYGRYLGGEVASHTRARIDASLSYEDFSDDPARHDRGLATATLSYPVAEGFYVSIGAVYATKPEFRGDVDAELSAKAGIIYKILTDE